MALLRSTLLILLVGSLVSLASCSSFSRSSNAIVVDDYSSMRYVKGKPDRVHKKWKAKSSYTPRNNKVAKRRTADW
ncbi:hypothetical protein [Pontibacter indicus]|uniref:Uncharacterized protein n=1 Tax=Pontibacter indicus TaxID=1317125 RepID=A0A1R3XRN2_9BACT|nr:hypothetical protein [Pontibacter indicus]SIT94520.1 hypothetical protein SAMN05444128_3618 [Pontibacter indicus]